MTTLALLQVDKPENIRQMQVDRNKAKGYERRNILNFDETGLNRKLTLNRTLAAEQSRLEEVEG
jgi:hypothetical protein